ncbi:dynamin family protein [Verrucosispora sioxanthis]|uniref:dynamin family protein n=1 Tax=Verrucosispora sioxanthis TaxID=2499994 RepID=UPI002E2957A5|nr:dynamin family protein [Verrucosispora sioxanthis]
MLVVGEPNQGKSQLVNAIVNAPVCPVGDGTTTVLPTVLRHAEVASATVVQTPLSRPGTPPAADPPAVRRAPVPTDQIAAESAAAPVGCPAAVPRTSRSACPGRCSAPAWCSSTCRAAVTSPPWVPAPRSPPWPARTPCCWSPTPLGTCR